MRTHHHILLTLCMHFKCFLLVQFFLSSLKTLTHMFNSYQSKLIYWLYHVSCINIHHPNCIQTHLPHTFYACHTSSSIIHIEYINLLTLTLTLPTSYIHYNVNIHMHAPIIYICIYLSIIYFKLYIHASCIQ